MSGDNLLIIKGQDAILEDTEAVNALLLNQLEAQAGDNQDAPPTQPNNPPEDTNEKTDQQDEDSIELEAIEPYIQSNFIGSKPDTKLGVQLEGSATDLQLADFSPLNQDILSAEQAFLLEELGFSAFFNQNTQGAFQNLGLLFFDSFINSLRNSSAINYDSFSNNNINRFDNQNSFLTSTPTVVAPPYNGPTLARNSALLTVEDTAGAHISNTILQTIDLNSSDGDLIYTMTNAPLYGQLELTTNAGVAITTFTQDDLDNNLIVYVHNGNETPSADGFIFDITDGTTTLIGRTFDITVKDFSEPLDFVTLMSPTPATQEYFGGYYVGFLQAGNNIIISDEGDGIGAPYAGSIYIYDIATGALLHTINNPTPEAGDIFGFRKTIDGNNLIVSVERDDTGATDAGSIYIYDISTGALLHTINNPTPETDDYFGQYTTIDGNNLIISVGSDNTGAPNAGSIYIYDIPTGSLLHTINNPTPEAFDSFGLSTTIIGNNLIIGDHRDDTGATDAGSIYIYDISTGALLHTINNPTPEANDYFGSRTTINGNNLIVGVDRDDTGALNAGSIYIYDISTGALLHTINNPTPEANDRFGFRKTIDGNHLIVNVTGDDTGATDAGSIYIYDVPTGSLLYTINNPIPEAFDYFGLSTTIIGNNLIIGDILENTGGTDAGSIYIYDISTGALLHTINNPTPEAGDYFGYITTVNENNLIVSVDRDNTGATNAGSIYIYDIPTGALLQTINNSTPEANDYFGSRTTINGNNLIVGVDRDNTGASNAGSIYIYDIPTGALLQTINNPTPEANSYFGGSLSIEDNTLITSGDNSVTGRVFYKYNIDFDDSDVLNGTDVSDVLYGLDGDDMLYGGGGADILFGGNGADRFVFEAGAVFAAEDRIEDFSISENDVLDISNILIGYNFGTDNIADFARFVDSGADSYLEIDANGASGGANFESVAIIVGGAGLDTAILEASGNLDSVV